MNNDEWILVINVERSSSFHNTKVLHSERSFWFSLRYWRFCRISYLLGLSQEKDEHGLQNLFEHLKTRKTRKSNIKNYLFEHDCNATLSRRESHKLHEFFMFTTEAQRAQRIFIRVIREIRVQKNVFCGENHPKLFLNGYIMSMQNFSAMNATILGGRTLALGRRPSLTNSWW